MEETSANSLKNNVSILFSDIKKYLEYKYQFAKLDFIEKTILITRLFVTFLILAIVFLTFILFLSFSIALYFGKVWNDNSLGFLCVAGVYFFIFILILLLKKIFIINPLTDFMLKIIFRKPKTGNKKKQTKMMRNENKSI